MAESWFEIATDVGNECCRLVQKHSGNWHVLQGLGWELRRTVDESEYVSDGRQSLWCEDCFPDIVFKDADGQVHVRVSDSNISLTECSA